MSEGSWYKRNKTAIHKAIKRLIILIIAILGIGLVALSPSISCAVKTSAPVDRVYTIKYVITNGGLGMAKDCSLYLQVRKDLLTNISAPKVIISPEYSEVTADEIQALDLQLVSPYYTFVKVDLGVLPPVWGVRLNQKTVEVKLDLSGATTQDIYLEKSWVVASGLLGSLTGDTVKVKVNAVAVS